ncbi:MAG: hypothetical protein LBJ03_04155 [Holosporales bacterium]|jgi:hypothetical protein|nr:hypothetical protein [Holosporales bacterium]
MRSFFYKVFLFVCGFIYCLGASASRPRPVLFETLQDLGKAADLMRGRVVIVTLPQEPVSKGEDPLTDHSHFAELRNMAEACTLNMGCSKVVVLLDRRIAMAMGNMCDILPPEFDINDIPQSSPAGFLLNFCTYACSVQIVEETQAVSAFLQTSNPTASVFDGSREVKVVQLCAFGRKVATLPPSQLFFGYDPRTAYLISSSTKCQDPMDFLSPRARNTVTEIEITCRFLKAALRPLELIMASGCQISDGKNEFFAAHCDVCSTRRFLLSKGVHEICMADFVFGVTGRGDRFQYVPDAALISIMNWSTPQSLMMPVLLEMLFALTGEYGMTPQMFDSVQGGFEDLGFDIRETDPAFTQRIDNSQRKLRNLLDQVRDRVQRTR